ncbi:MAG: DUF115 domain-containing protein [Synergistetes bacterium]|nr:DUF115 domain-containing protein [Synergistota bacterium]MDW8192009.1 DUF115 domain-containing protein [Synergistota bacterium]
MDFFSKNLQLLKHKDRELYSRLKKVPEAPYVSFILSKTGKLVAQVLGKDGKRYLLHSAYDPLAEVEEVASKINWVGVSHVVVLGLGCGYQLIPILKKVPENVKVYAVEPDISLFRKVLEVIDWSEILSFPNLNLIVGFSPSVAVEAIMKSLNPSELKAIEFLKHPVYYRLLFNYFSELERELSESIRISLVNLITALQFSFRDQKNTLLNLKYLLLSSPVKNLFRAFSGKPAVIVCAGPSLDKNIDYLKEVRDKALLIAVDTALRPLIVRNIRPHIVVAGDPQEANFDHFRIIDPEETKNIFLVADLRVSSLIFDFWKGGIFICDFGSEIMRWIKGLLGEVGRLTVWGSVSTVAISLAYEFGCDPLILIGQDLAYTGFRRYASYTWIDETTNNLVDPEGEGLIKDRDLWGREVWTARNMVAYRDWLGQFFRKTKGLFVNSTEGGILKEEVKIVNFVDIANRVLRDTFDSLSVIRKRWTPFRRNERIKSVILEEINSLKGKVRKIKSFCEEKLSLLERCCDKIVEGVRNTEGELKLLWKEHPWLGDVFLPYFLSFNREIEKSRTMPPENSLVREYEAYVFLFTGVKNMALKYEEAIDTSIKLLREG